MYLEEKYYVKILLSLTVYNHHIHDDRETIFSLTLQMTTHTGSAQGKVITGRSMSTRRFRHCFRYALKNKRYASDYIQTFM